MKKIFKLNLFFKEINNKLIIALMVAVSCITLDIAITKPATYNYFLQHCSYEGLPYAWLTVIPCSILVIYTYTTMLKYFSSLALFSITVVLTILSDIISYAFIDDNRILTFIQFIWRDIYVLFIFKQLWSLIHSAIDRTKMNIYASLFYAVGSITSIIGGFIPYYFAKYNIPITRLYIVSVPLMIALWYSYYYAYNNSKHDKQEVSFILGSNNDIVNLVKYIFNRSILRYTLILLIMVAFNVAVADYQFNYLLKTTKHLFNDRVEYSTIVAMLPNICSLLFNVFGGSVLIYAMGLRSSHHCIYALIAIQIFVFVLFPSLGSAAFCIYLSKWIEYTFFPLMRELIYANLGINERYKIRAIIDVVGFRLPRAIPAVVLIASSFVIPRAYALSILISVMVIVWSYFYWQTTAFVNRDDVGFYKDQDYVDSE